MKTTQTQAESKTDIIVRGVEAHEVGEAEQILKDYQRAVSQMPEIEGGVYMRRKRSIEFVVVVDRIRRKLSSQLSQIECRLCDEYTDSLSPVPRRMPHRACTPPQTATVLSYPPISR